MTEKELLLDDLKKDLDVCRKYKNNEGYVVAFCFGTSVHFDENGEVIISRVTRNSKPMPLEVAQKLENEHFTSRKNNALIAVKPFIKTAAEYYGEIEKILISVINRLN
jgi:hypothetical protein